MMLWGKARAVAAAVLAVAVLSGGVVLAETTGEPTPEPSPAADAAHVEATVKQALSVYLDAMAEPKPLLARKGEEFKAHQKELREKLLRSMNLSPLPERVPLDVHMAEPTDHPWCTVRRVFFQVWPGVYQNGLLYMPKEFAEKPAPALLNPCGHFSTTDAWQMKHQLTFAKMGYVVFVPVLQHFEALGIGVSNQTILVWCNMRALDFLQSLPEVDGNRIGCHGFSGGGMQTQQLVGLDTRVKAAAIVGYTADCVVDVGRYGGCPPPQFAGDVCNCNHYPWMMRYTDNPEISALGLPAAVKHETMNDCGPVSTGGTRTFMTNIPPAKNSFPAVKRLYEANGVGERAACFYTPAKHGYGRDMRERTYRWMEKWLRNKSEHAMDDGFKYEPDDIKALPESKLKTLPKLGDKGSEALAEWLRKCDNSNGALWEVRKGFNLVAEHYQKTKGYRVPSLADRTAWLDYRKNMQAALGDLLGENIRLPRLTNAATRVSPDAHAGLDDATKNGIAVERYLYPSEGSVLIPVTILRAEKAGAKLPVVLFCDGRGANAPLAGEPSKGADSPLECARKGSLAVLMDTRLSGPCLVKPYRAMILWGRPIVGMACTDIRSVLDGLSTRPDADMEKIRIVGRNSGPLGVAVLFAAALDGRIKTTDVDLCGYKFDVYGDKYIVPFIMQYGDVPQWAALLAERNLILRGLSNGVKTSEREWLAGVFSTLGNAQGLELR